MTGENELHETNHIEERTQMGQEPTRDASMSAALKKGLLARRLISYFAGMFVLALGVSVSIKSNLGVSPINSLPYVYSQVLGWDMGVVTALLFTCYVLLQILLLGKAFKWINLLQIALGILFGSFVSVTNRLLAFETPASYFVRLLLLAVSILLIAMAFILILTPQIMPQPPEGLILAIQKRKDWSFSRIKVGFDCISVSLATISSLLFFREIIGVREGTVLAALLIGIVIGFMRKLGGEKLERFLGKPDAA